MTQRSKTRGFTLVELMVALTAGTIAAGGAYVLSANSTRNIGEQMRIGDTQMSLRGAIEQIRRDFARAAYLGVPNVLALPAPMCPDPTSTIALVAPTTGLAMATSLSGAGVYVDGSRQTNPLFLPGGAAVTTLLNATDDPAMANAQNLTRADLVMIQGSFAAGMMFPVSNVGAPGNFTIAVDDQSATFQMVFYNAPPDGSPRVLDTARFNATFAAGRVARFESLGRYYFRVITGSNGAAVPPTITLDGGAPGLPDDGCAPRAGAFVSVMSLMQYQLDPIDGGSNGDGNIPADLLALKHPTVPIANLARGSKRVALVRRELSYANQTPLVPSTATVILDNAVEFQVNAVRDLTPTGPTPTFERLTGLTAPTVQTVSTGGTGADSANQLRALIVTLSARSMEGDRLPMHRARASLEMPMFTFTMGDANTPSDATFFVSRVRTIRSEYFYPIWCPNEAETTARGFPQETT